MKDKYLGLLKQGLEEKNLGRREIDEIIKEYGQLYDDALESGKSHETIESLLGNPMKVAKEVEYENDLNNSIKGSGKIIAIMPFISLIVFMVLGLIFGVWHPTWLVFLLIPVTAIILESKGFSRVIALVPFIALVVFFLLGTYLDLWNPGWLVFLLLPMIAITKKQKLGVVIFYEFIYLLAIGFYLYMGYVYDLWTYGALGFILPFLLGLWYGDIIIEFPFNLKSMKKKDFIFLTIIFSTIIIFLLAGFLFSAWAYAWQVFLFIPMTAILIYEGVNITAISPFISVMLFYSLGYFLNLWTISWLAFLMIPISGILFTKKET